MSSLVENGAGTGWTVTIKQSYFSNIINIKLYLMQENLQIGSNFSFFLINLYKTFEVRGTFINYLLKGYTVMLLKVKCKMVETILLTRRLFAWINKLTKLKLNFIHQRLNVEHLISSFSTLNVNKKALSENKDMFYQWLVGFTDGDGTFSIVRQNNKWSLTYKLGQSTYNLRLLHFVKKQLGVGSIYVEKTGDVAHFRIRDRITLDKVIFPIFDKYPLLTTKQFNYIKFKEAHSILSNSTLSNSEKDSLIYKIINTKPAVDYISPIWSVVNNKVSNVESASMVIKKAWLIGFTEAEGSFYIVSKSKNRLVHAFEITQKLDEIVLIAIKHILGISTQVKIKKGGNYSIVTTNSRAIENIIKYFKNTMKGMKSVEYRIWSRSYNKHKGEFDSLKIIRKKIRIMRKKRYTLEDIKMK